MALGLMSADALPSAFAVVMTHDCDLACTPDRDPHIEIIVAQVVGKADGRHTHSKNPRCLHLEFRQGDDVVIAELMATGKVKIDKGELAAFVPSEAFRLDPENLKVLQHWLAARYRRAAFSGEFENRLKKNKLDKEIARILEPASSSIVAIFFDVDAGEEVNRIGPEDIYTLDVQLIYSTAKDPEEAHAAALKAQDAIVAAFRNKLYTPVDGWRLIELRSCDVSSEESFSFKDSRTLKQWHLEYLSFSQGDTDSIAD